MKLYAIAPLLIILMSLSALSGGIVGWLADHRECAAQKAEAP